MITALVKYQVWQEPPHPLLDGYYLVKSKIIEVQKLTEINKIFSNVLDVNVIDDNGLCKISLLFAMNFTRC